MCGRVQTECDVCVVRWTEAALNGPYWQSIRPFRERGAATSSLRCLAAWLSPVGGGGDGGRRLGYQTCRCLPPQIAHAPQNNSQKKDVQHFRRIPACSSASAHRLAVVVSSEKCAARHCLRPPKVGGCAELQQLVAPGCSAAICHPARIRR
jgi:hypothetical protein